MCTHAHTQLLLVRIKLITQVVNITAKIHTMYLVIPYATEVPKIAAKVSGPTRIRKKLITSSSGKMHATNAINKANCETRNKQISSKINSNVLRSFLPNTISSA